MTPIQKEIRQTRLVAYLSNKGFSDRDLLLRELADSTDFWERFVILQHMQHLQNMLKAVKNEMEKNQRRGIVY